MRIINCALTYIMDMFLHKKGNLFMVMIFDTFSNPFNLKLIPFPYSKIRTELNVPTRIKERLNHLAL